MLLSEMSVTDTPKQPACQHRDGTRPSRRLGKGVEADVDRRLDGGIGLALQAVRQTTFPGSELVIARSAEWRPRMVLHERNRLGWTPRVEEVVRRARRVHDPALLRRGIEEHKLVV